MTWSQLSRADTMVIAEGAGSLLANVDALAVVSGSVKAGSSRWSTHVLPAHAALETHKEEAASCSSGSLTEALIPLGSTVHFACATPASADRARRRHSTGGSDDGGEALAAALRLANIDAQRALTYLARSIALASVLMG